MVVDQERRAGARAPLAGTAVIHVRDSKVACEILDVGAMGIGLMAPRNVEQGEFVRVVFRLGAANSPERLHEADGVVVGALDRSIGYRLGIQFTVIEGHVASQIHDYVSEHAPDPEAGRRTGEYAPVAAYPPAEDEQAARVTAEYPAAEEEEQVQAAATGTDGDIEPRGISGRPVRRGGGNRPTPALSYPRGDDSGKAKAKAKAKAKPTKEAAQVPGADEDPPPQSEHDLPIDRELLNLYLDAVRTVDRSRHNKKKN